MGRFSCTTGTRCTILLQINIHAYNESATIAEVIRQIPAHLEGITEIRTVVVDDGSTDGTARIARAAGAEVLGWRSNRGLGRAYHAGLQDAISRGAGLLVTIDGDGQFNAGDIAMLIEPVLAADADMATCSRFADPTLVPDMPGIKLYGNRLVAAIISALTGKRFSDVSCGFRAYNRECLLRLNLMGEFTYTHEVIMELVFKGLRVVEVPLAVRGEREHGTSRVASSVLRYGWRTLRIIMGTLMSQRPHLVFGVGAAVSAALATVCAVIGFVPWWIHGTFIKSLMLIGGFFFGLSVLLILFGLQSRIMKRNQFLMECVLFELRSQDRRSSTDSAASESMVELTSQGSDGR